MPQAEQPAQRMPGAGSRWNRGKDLSWEPLRDRAGLRGRLRPPPGRPLPPRDDVPALAPRPLPERLPLRPARDDGPIRAGADLRLTRPDAVTERSSSADHTGEYTCPSPTREEHGWMSPRTREMRAQANPAGRRVAARGRVAWDRPEPDVSSEPAAAAASDPWRGTSLAVTRGRQAPEPVRSVRQHRLGFAVGAQPRGVCRRKRGCGEIAGRRHPTSRMRPSRRASRTAHGRVRRGCSRRGCRGR